MMTYLVLHDAVVMGDSSKLFGRIHLQVECLPLGCSIGMLMTLDLQQAIHYYTLTVAD